MGYLNEDGLETLVGKIKGQAIELTSAEYRQLPSTKNTDNKLYFVTDEAYAYQIDDEPTANSSGLVKSGGVYNWTSKIGSGTLTTTAQTIIPAVNELNAKIGSTDISAIGDGTVTGAVDALNAGLTQVIITREYTISLEQNANVSPFRYYGMVAADSIPGYTPIAAQFVGRSTTTNGVVQATDILTTFHVYTYNSWTASEGIKLRVIYLKNS